MKYRIFLLFFIGFCGGTPFTQLIEVRDIAGILQLISSGYDPERADIEYSDHILCLVGRRLLPEEKLQLGQLIDAVDVGHSSYQLSFSMVQVKNRGPDMRDLLINCMLRYFSVIRASEFDSLIGRSLGKYGTWTVFPELVDEILNVHNSVSP